MDWVVNCLCCILLCSHKFQMVHVKFFSIWHWQNLLSIPLATGVPNSYFFSFIDSVLAVLASCVTVEPISALPDIIDIVSGLSQKTRDILGDIAVPILNAQVDFIRKYIEKWVSLFKGQEGEVSIIVLYHKVIWLV